MIRMVSGTVVHVTDTAVEVDVNGLGHLVYVSVPTTQFTIGRDITLHTHLAVRETALDLYGFIDRDTLEIFELLITLPKIGPKSAQQLLRQADIDLLKQAVFNNDAGYLSKMSGIGKKSAEKIVAGLKERFEATNVQPGGQTAVGSFTKSYAEDTVDALVALGYALDEARKTVRIITEDHPDIDSSQDALKHALKLLSQ